MMKPLGFYVSAYGERQLKKQIEELTFPQHVRGCMCRHIQGLVRHLHTPPGEWSPTQLGSGAAPLMPLSPLPTKAALVVHRGV